MPGDLGEDLAGEQHAGRVQQYPDPVYDGPSRAAALPRIPAVTPAETLRPVSAATSFAARETGR